MVSKKTIAIVAILTVIVSAGLLSPFSAQALTRAQIKAELRELFQQLAFWQQKLRDLMASLQAQQDDRNNTLTNEEIRSDAELYSAMTRQTLDSVVAMVYRTYRPNEKSDSVLELQRFLNRSNPQVPVDEDGQLDEETELAVKVWQEQYSLASVLSIVMQAKGESLSALTPESKLAVFFSSFFPHAEAAGSILMYLEGQSACQPASGMPIMMDASGNQKCFKKSGNECVVIGQGEVITTCGTVGSAGASGSGGTYFSPSPTIIKCDKQQCGGADQMVGNIIQKSGTLGSGVTPPTPETAMQDLLMSVVSGLGKSMLGQCMSNDIVGSLSSILSGVLGMSSGQLGGNLGCGGFNSLAGGCNTLSPASRGAVGAGGIAVKSGNLMSLMNNQRRSASVALASTPTTYIPGSAYICYDDACNLGIGVNPRTGKFTVMSIPRDSDVKYYKVKDI